MNTEYAHTPLVARDPDAVALGNRIEGARGATTRKTLGARLGVHENTLGKWERGETVPTVLQLLQISKETGMGLGYLLGVGQDIGDTYADTHMPMSADAVTRGAMTYVPLFDVRAAAGHGAINLAERVSDMRCFNTEFIRRELGIAHNQICMITVVGASAEPEVHAGDVVLVDRRDTDVTVEGLHLVRIDDALMIKLLQRRPGSVVVSSRNDAYATFEVQLNGGTDFEVLGRCRWAGITLR